MDKLLSIKKVSEILDVHIDTLRRWDNDGKLKAVRTEGGHRKYKLSDVCELLGEDITEENKNEDATVIYCRVSSHDQKQKGDLDRQKSRLMEYCLQQKYNVEYIFEEVGSGINDNRSKLNKMMTLAEKGKINRVVVEHKDRLTRFNKNIYIRFFKSHGVEVVWSRESLTKSFENELVEDMLSLISIFSSKIYGKRSADKRRKKKEEGGK